MLMNKSKWPTMPPTTAYIAIPSARTAGTQQAHLFIVSCHCEIKLLNNINYIYYNIMIIQVCFDDLFYAVEVYVL